MESLGTSMVKMQKVKSPKSQSSSRSLSGVHTPFGKPSVAGNNTQRSAGYYFDQLNNHFKANNDMNRFAITITKFVCQIYDGKDVVHRELVDANDSTSIRNLYLMFYASDYNVLNFLSKRDNGEFGNFNGKDDKGNRIGTPPQYDERSNVFILESK